MTSNSLSPLTPPGLPGGPTLASAPPGGAARFTPLDPIRVLRQYAKHLVAAAALGFIIGVALFFYKMRYSPEYSSTAQLLVTGGVSTPYETSGAAGIPRVQADMLAAL